MANSDIGAYNVFDRVTFTADILMDTCMITTAEYCIAAIGLNAYQHERSCHDLIILPLPARLYASQNFSCCIKPIAVLHLTVDGCNFTRHRMFIAHSATTMIGSGCPKVL